MGLKIKKIQRIYTQEPAYDISVDSTSHNFQLGNGIFVHNSLKIPKQYLGDTDDNSGFNGGTSLSLISSRYAKTIKRIQSSMVQMLTDVINIFLLDKGLDSYVNKFVLRMQAPTTQEEKDRQEKAGSKINMITDIMNLLDNAGMQENSLKLKIFKSLLSSTINDPEVINLIQEQVEQLENIPDEEQQMQQDEMSDETNSDVQSSFEPSDETTDIDVNINDNTEQETGTETQQNEPGDEMILPTPGELNAGDFSDMNNSEI